MAEESERQEKKRIKKDRKREKMRLTKRV